MFGGLRWNQWVALAAILGGVGYIIITRNKPYPIVATADVDADVEADAESMRISMRISMRKSIPKPRPSSPADADDDESVDDDVAEHGAAGEPDDPADLPSSQ